MSEHQQTNNSKTSQHRQESKKAQPTTEQSEGFVFTDTPLIQSLLSGDDPRPHITPEQVMQLQRMVGNQQTISLLNGSRPVIQSKRITLENGEKLYVSSKATKEEQKQQKEEAEAIIKRIKDNYNIDVSSKASKKAIIDDYGLTGKMKANLRTRSWQLRELQALERALKHYAPILGTERDTSVRKGNDQELTSVGSIDKGVSMGDKGPYFESTTLGEYFGDAKNFTAFRAGITSAVDFADNDKQLEATFVHEISHGLLKKYLLSDFVTMFRDYWADKSTRVSGNSKVGASDGSVEAPITNYGATNANEDLSETVMFYFVEPATLSGGNTKENPGKTPGTPGNPAPRRKQFVDDAVDDWKSTPEMATLKMQARIAASVKDPGAGKAAPAEDIAVLDAAYNTFMTTYNGMAEDQRTFVAKFLRFAIESHRNLVTSRTAAPASP